MNTQKNPQRPGDVFGDNGRRAVGSTMPKVGVEPTRQHSVAQRDRAKWDARRKGENRVCPTCGSGFYVKRSRINAGAGTCCSRRCADAHRVASNVSADPQQRAHGLINMRVRRGLIVKPRACQECGREARLDGHHDDTDYSKPSEVRWLCRRCHMKHHAQESA